MIRDPIADLQPSVAAFLVEECGGAVDVDAEIDSAVRWRPHLLERSVPRAWYIHVTTPEGDSWARRAQSAQQAMSELRVGVAVQFETVLDKEVLDWCDELDASIVILREKRGKLQPDEYFNSLADMICEKRVKLDAEIAISLLDRALARALAEPNDQKKGVLLEVVCALLMSQVDGFETTSKGVSNRTQQMDVLVHSRITSGVLSASPIVLVEAKNWPKTPVTPVEYAVFERKVGTRHQRCKLGFLVTTGKFTSGLDLERRRDSKDDRVLVFVDGKQLPKLWRGKKALTEEIEDIVIQALVGD